MSTATQPVTLDLTGLPVPVVQNLRQLVQTLRENLALVDSTVSASEPRLPLRGRFAHLGCSFPKEMIDEWQREMWASFPRELPEPPKS